MCVDLFVASRRSLSNRPLTHQNCWVQEVQKTEGFGNCQTGEDWTWNNLNTLCWAIGSVSGSMVEEQENRFLVMVIPDLLNLCEITKGKDNKAVIASNIMYVVGQYPRFLRAHWKFLKTVVNKLFEFMHEIHPGVQDMACDTFLKIVQKCKRKLVILQVGENEPFVLELLTTLSTTIVDLEPHQIHSFYESVGNMIQAESDPHKRDEYLQRLMVLPNQKWAEIIGQAHQNVDFLKDPDVIKAVINILQTNTSAACSLGMHFLPQITLIYMDMLNVYRMYSELISTSIAQGGPHASRTYLVKLLRSVKREALKLIETFLEKSSLSLFATIINKYKRAMIEDVPRIFEAVFQCTLEMITKNFEDYPEHRLKFFSLLKAIAAHCFPALIHLSSEQLKLVMDSIIWAFRHTERNIAETGLSLLLEMLKNFQSSKFCNQFYRTYFVTIEQEIFAVLTDTFHKPGFKLHVLVLQHLLCLDKLMTVQSDASGGSASSTSWLFKNKEHGKTSATASLGMILLWDVYSGFAQLDKYFHSTDSHVTAGALLGVGIVNCNVLNECDLALDLLAEYVGKEDPSINIDAIMGLGLAYADSKNVQVHSLLMPLLGDGKSSLDAIAFAAISLGLVYVGSCYEDVAQAIIFALMDRSEYGRQPITVKNQMCQKPNVPIDGGLREYIISKLSFKY